MARHSGISKKMTTENLATVETLLSNKQYLSAVQYAYQACTTPYERLHVHVSDFVELSPSCLSAYYLDATLRHVSTPPALAHWQSRPFRVSSSGYHDAGLLLYRPHDASVRLTVELKHSWTHAVLAQLDLALSDVTDHTAYLRAHGGSVTVRVRHVPKCSTLADLNAMPRTRYVLPLTNQCSSVLEAITRPGNHRAVLWLPGRNGSFAHPHVAQRFLAAGVDVYILNYRGLFTNGPTLGLGTTHLDPRFGSHVPSGSFSAMWEDIDAGLAHIRAQPQYNQILQYSHSTGALLMTTYLMNRGDGAFSAFYFNSPFLDWGDVGGALKEFVLKHLLPVLLTVVPKMDMCITTGTGFDADRMRIYATHEFPLVNIPMVASHVTAGFVCASSNAITQLEERHHQNQTLTSKPVGCVGSVSDNVLVHAELMARIAWVGTNTPLPHLVLDTGSHDVFVSPLQEDVNQALDHLSRFLDVVALA